MKLINKRKKEYYQTKFSNRKKAAMLLEDICRRLSAVSCYMSIIPASIGNDVEVGLALNIQGIYIHTYKRIGKSISLFNKFSKVYRLFRLYTRMGRVGASLSDMFICKYRRCYNLI